MQRQLVTAVACCALLASAASASIWDTLKQAVGGLGGQSGAPGPTGLTSEEVAAGLREALRVGAERAVGLASRPGGFLDDPSIRIPLPDRLQTVGRMLRSLGMGSEVDAFEETLNRAAERAAGKALPIFGDAVSALTFEDVHRIWRGEDDAATQHLDRTTRPRLAAEFEPVVRAAAQEVGVTQAYQGLTRRPEVSALVAGTDLDLDHYVTGRALDGVFALLAAEERRIRTEPAARTTELLRKIFQR
ncbi:MAG: DUF4197 domain-containing protein [Deferrisomatales bacterium]|nr:DUF4197 domain-containing protein [Deferrisomatales bacterium]